jgi:hypothetical protein
MAASHPLLAPVRQLHNKIRDAVVKACACEGASTDALAGVAREEEGDTIYAIDCISEELVIEFFEHEVAPSNSLVLIA